MTTSARNIRNSFSIQKIRSFCCLILALCQVATVLSQDRINPWMIGVEYNTLSFFSIPKWQPSFSYQTLSLHRYTGDGFSMGARFSSNTVKTVADSGPKNINYTIVEGVLKYNIDHIIPMQKFNPYLEVGLGFSFADRLSTLNPMVNAGLTYWVFKHLGVNVHISYKSDFNNTSLNVAQYLGGISIRLGGGDSDGDGVYNKLDVCPDLAGAPHLRGCPDSDYDGVENIKDECPHVKGLPELLGCPDADLDGIPDGKDSCPKVPGTYSLNGCPDNDSDGIVDKEDQCPTQAGPPENNGCPLPDRDLDTVPDQDDKCPDETGSVATKGCPEIMSKEIQKKINDYAKVILFNTGTADIKEESFEILRAISYILNDFPNSKFVVAGHTDNVGGEELNQKISEERANAVRNQLINLGIPEVNLVAIGYGETRPISTNSTENGRKDNRRVEVNLVR